MNVNLTRNRIYSDFLFIEKSKFNTCYTVGVTMGLAKGHLSGKLDWEILFSSVWCGTIAGWRKCWKCSVFSFLSSSQPIKYEVTLIHPLMVHICVYVCLHSSGCVLNRQDVRLILHYDRGFTVTRESGEPVLFHFPYERLKMSADDGVRNLYLDFGAPEGEMVWHNNIYLWWCHQMGIKFWRP